MGQFQFSRLLRRSVPVALGFLFVGAAVGHVFYPPSPGSAVAYSLRLLHVHSAVFVSFMVALGLWLCSGWRQYAAIIVAALFLVCSAGILVSVPSSVTSCGCFPGAALEFGPRVAAARNVALALVAFWSSAVFESSKIDASATP
jgi:hypothetical protein